MLYPHTLEVSLQAAHTLCCVLQEDLALEGRFFCRSVTCFMGECDCTSSTSSNNSTVSPVKLMCFLRATAGV